MRTVQSDIIGGERLSSLNGSPLLFCDLGRQWSRAVEGGILIGIDREGRVPELAASDFDVLITTESTAAAPWVVVGPDRLDAQLQIVALTAEKSPIASAMLARVLRLQEALDFDSALEVESLAYSTLLGGSEFAQWARESAGASSASQAPEPVHYDRAGDAVTLILQSAGNHNAMTAAMRDALYEALVNVLEDPSLPAVTLRGEGKCFSTGGDLGEFGTARDLAQAHIIRTQRSCARLLHRLGARATVRLHGACIGSGIEVPAAAARRVGSRDSFFQLPELKMGLIPGAGGTVSIGHAIGRHRLMWMCLGAFRIDARQALDWGLLHEIEQ